MNFSVFALTFALFATSAPSAERSDPAPTSTIDSTVASLRKWTYGINAYVMTETSAREMLSSHATEEVESDQFTVIDDLEGRSIPEVDGGGSVYGILGISAAAQMFSDFRFENTPPTERQSAALLRMFRTMANAGAVFAYGPQGGRICGVTYPSLFVMDVAAGSMYEVLFVGGSC